jgi:hypothetical protein
MSGTYPRNVIWVWFEYTATLSDRQRAIDGICGEVVGAVLYSGAGPNVGMYYVRVVDDGTDEALFAAIATLKRLPQVRIATPDMSFQFGPA